jgi:hypothetical protein
VLLFSMKHSTELAHPCAFLTTEGWTSSIPVCAFRSIPVLPLTFFHCAQSWLKSAPSAAPAARSPLAAVVLAAGSAAGSEVDFGLPPARFAVCYLLAAYSAAPAYSWQVWAGDGCWAYPVLPAGSKVLRHWVGDYYRVADCY